MVRPRLLRWSSSVVKVIVPVTPVASMMIAPESRFAELMAARSDPAPESFVLLTVHVAGRMRPPSDSSHGRNARAPRVLCRCFNRRPEGAVCRENGHTIAAVLLKNGG